MLHDSSSGAAADKKPHWTQTPAGKKKMSRAMKKAHKKNPKWKRAVDRVTKRESYQMDIYVLAKRLHRMVNEAAREQGINDLLIAAHTLTKQILGK